MARPHALYALIVVLPLIALGLFDIATSYNVLASYPVIGHLRYMTAFIGQAQLCGCIRIPRPATCSRQRAGKFLRQRGHRQRRPALITLFSDPACSEAMIGTESETCGASRRFGPPSAPTRKPWRSRL